VTLSTHVSSVMFVCELYMYIFCNVSANDYLFLYTYACTYGFFS